MTTKRKPGGRQHSVKVVESSRIRIAQALVAFRESNDAVYTFEADLSNAERALVHQQCSKMGMSSKSQGRGKQRCVSVYKRNTKKITKKTEKENEFPNLTQLEFSEGTREVLMDLFMRYPPGEEAEDNVIYGNKSDKNEASFRKKDTIFSKPSMDKTEMAKKLQLLASKRKDSVSLRKITEETYRLPIASYKDVITSTVESNQVVLISGETGCGKTTQVPQFILDHVWGKGEACKIVCTQPRRISATSVAERISHERAQVVGQDIGYKIRLESKGGKHSSVVFCTNGILLRMLVSRGAGRSKEDTSNKEIKQDLNDITHIIMDEIHERDRHSDFMLAIIRDMLSSLPHLHLIMMSATVDAERFSEYFGGCPVIRVPGFTYPVTTFYLEDVLSILKSAENNHLDTLVGSETEDPDLTGDDKLGLDEAINLAWSKDEYDPLLEFVSIEGTHKVFNYQHSLTGLTPLMVFAGKGRTEDVCMLLSFGADCQLRAKDGKTALDLAEWEDQPETTQILKEHIEDVLSNSMKEQLLVDKYLKYYNPENIDVVLIEQLLRKICSDSEDGAILVFLPGWDDINKTRDRLLMNPYFRDSSKCLILSLHSMVPSIEQKKVFKRPPHGCRKIILATNMAETAITIDDVVYVIDSGRMKEKNYDPYNNASTLQSSWVSKASAKQRRGRAGRCQPGFCYHLYSKARADSLPDFQVPEIKRMPIEELCLQVKLLDPDCKVEDFLSKTLDPPIFETIRNAIRVLQDIGALSLDEKLTELGEKLGSLPCHPLTSKMLFFAILMNCLDPALTLACAADYKDPFTLPMSPDERKRAAAAKFELSSLYGGYSDQLAVIAAFDCWNMAKQRGQEKMFCSQYFVSPSTMQMLSGMRSQLQSELIRNGFLPEDVSRCSLNSRVPGILRALLVAGLYPMVGRLLPPLKNGKRSIIETANGGKVRLNAYSINFKLSTSKIIEGHRPLIVYDEITRGEGDMNIRNCTVVAPLPLLLLSTEIAVAPASSDDNDDDDDEGSDVDDSGDESDEDTMEMDGKAGGKQEKKIMSSPDNSVVVIADRWLPFRAKALAVAQIYCLRERLSAAILFKITHPQKVLPPSLWTSVYVIAFALMHDGLPVDLPPSVEIATETEDKYMPAPQHFSPLMSLLNDNATHPHRQSPRYSLRRRVGLGPYQERGRGIMPYGNNERMHVNPHDAYQSGPYYLGAHVSHETHPHRPHQHGTWLPDSDGAAKPPLQGNGVAELSSAQSLLVPAPVTARQKPPPSEGTNTALRAKKRRHRARNIKGR